MLDGRGRWSAEVGAAIFAGERASLAGTEGRLWELGRFGVGRGFGRVAVRVTGTAYRIFEDRSVFQSPHEGPDPPILARREDVGDLRVETLVRIGRWGALEGGLRFGTRLPTTDDDRGLERDRTDFWAGLAAGWRSGRVRIEGEAGLAILSTREELPEQVDPLIGSLRLAYEGRTFEPWVAAVWQRDLRRGPNVPGVEDSGELRLGLHAGRSWSVRLEGMAGLEPFDPDWGVGVSVARSW